MIPFGAYFEPVAQLDDGLAYHWPGLPTAYYISGVAIVTFGFIVSELWNYCDADATTVWTAISDETTTWSVCP
jgi:hypothetical protein